MLSRSTKIAAWASTIVLLVIAVGIVYFVLQGTGTSEKWTIPTGAVWIVIGSGIFLFLLVVTGTIFLAISPAEKRKVRVARARPPGAPATATGTPGSVQPPVPPGLWEKIKNKLRYAYILYFLAPYYAISFVFYMYIPELWEPWPGNLLVFFVLIPIAILFVVWAIKSLEDHGKVPIVFAFLFLGFVGYVTLNKYKETSWWKTHTEKVQEIARVKAVEAATPVRYQYCWTKTPGVAGRNEEVRDKCSSAVIEINSGNMFQFVVYYPHSDGKWYKSTYFGTRTGSRIEGTWSQPNPKEEGEWYLTETSPGSGRYVGQCTDGSLGGNWIAMWLEPKN